MGNANSIYIGHCPRVATSSPKAGLGLRSGTRGDTVGSYSQVVDEAIWTLFLSLQFLVNCNNIQNLPTFTFIINGVQFPLPPSSYILNVSLGP